MAIKNYYVDREIIGEETLKDYGMGTYDDVSPERLLGVKVDGTVVEYDLAQLQSAPFITKASSNCFPPSSTTTVTVVGSGFWSGTTFESTGGSFSNYVYLSPTEIQVDFSATGTTGVYTIEALNGLQSSTQFAGSLSTIEVQNVTSLVPGDGTTSWDNVSGLVTTGNGFIESNSTTSSWDKQGTFGPIADNKDFVLSFTLGTRPATTTTGYGMYGFGIDPTSNTSYNTIDHSIYLQNQNTSANLYIYENGSSRGAFGTVAVGDLLEIERSGGVVTYKQNGTVFYTSPTASTGAVHFDSSIYRMQRIENLKMESC